MKNKIYIPNESDWDFLLRVFKKIGVSYNVNNDGLDYFQLIFLMKLTSQIYDGVPYGLYEVENNYNLQSMIISLENPEIQITGKDGTITRNNLNKISSISKIRIRGEEKFPQLVEANSFKKWEDKYTEIFHREKIFQNERFCNNDFKSKRTKNEFGYRITGSGLVASMFSLITPTLNATRKGRGESNFQMNTILLGEENKVVWSKEFIFQNNILTTNLHLKTFSEIDEQTNGETERFWKMFSPLTLALLELVLIEINKQNLLSRGDDLLKTLPQANPRKHKKNKEHLENWIFEKTKFYDETIEGFLINTLINKYQIPKSKYKDHLPPQSFLEIWL